MRPKKLRIVQVVEECGIFGECLCGGDIIFYSDSGVKCKDCGKLYGTWLKRKNRKPRLSTVIKDNMETSVSIATEPALMAQSRPLL